MKTTKKQTRRSKLVSIYHSIGLISVPTEKMEENGTFKFYDPASGNNYIFRRFSNPRVEYYSEKTNTIQSYSLFKNPVSSIEESLLIAIPYVVNRRVNGSRENIIEVAEEAINSLKLYSTKK